MRGGAKPTGFSCGSGSTADHGYALYSAIKKRLQETEDKALSNDLLAPSNLSSLTLKATHFLRPFMVNTAIQPLTFEEYLVYDDGTDNHYKLIDGLLVLMHAFMENGVSFKFVARHHKRIPLVLQGIYYFFPSAHIKSHYKFMAQKLYTTAQNEACS